MTKPTDGAADVGRYIANKITTDPNARKRLAAELADDIDREAVAPAVREMNIALKKAHEAIEALIRAEQNPQNDRIAFKASDAVTYARRMKKATSAKYRHLIEESEQ